MTLQCSFGPNGQEDFILVHDIEGNIVDVSHCAIMALGYTKTELLGLKMFDLHPPEFHDISRHAIHKIKENNYVKFEIPFRRKNGESFPARVASVLFDSGERTLVQGVIRDMSRPLGEEKAARELEWRYRTIFEHTVDGIVVADAQLGVIVSANPAICTMLGYGETELVGMPVEDLYPLREVAGFQRQACGEFQSGSGVSVRRWDGSELIADVSTAFAMFDGGQYLLGVFRKADGGQACLRHECIPSSGYREILDKSGDALLVWDARTGVIVEANSRACSLLGMKEEEIVGAHEGDIVLEETSSENKDGNGLARARALHASGHKIPVETYTGKMASGGRSLRFRVLRDASGLEAIEKRLYIVQAALDNAVDPIALGYPGRGLTYVNKAFLRAWGGEDESEVLGRSLSDFCSTPEIIEGVIAALEASDRWSGEIEMRRRDGSDFLVELSASTVRSETGELLCMMGTFADITERRIAEEKLKRMVRIVEQASEGIAVVDLDGRVTYVNKAWADMHGTSIADAVGKSFTMFHPDHQRAGDIVTIAEALESAESYTTEIAHRRADGTEFPAYLIATRLTDTSGATLGMVCFAIDITERKIMEEELEQRVLYDTLTGLPNRALLYDRIRTIFARTRRDPSVSFAVMLIDLDRFKRINDCLGHTHGDTLLIEVARRLSSCIRLGDTVARFGGDEFAVVLEGVEEDDIKGAATRFQGAMRPSFEISGEEAFVTMSIGIAMGNSGYTTPEEMIRDADTAMYNAKALGRDRFVLFAPDMHDVAVESMTLQNDLHKAIETEAFALHYQPIVSLVTGKVVGAEALLRWNHPKRGTLGPMTFIPMAEDTGLIHPLGEWTLREACGQARKWREAFASHPGMYVSVNICGKQFTPELTEIVRRILQETDLGADRLKLEITESVLIENADRASGILARLRDLGVEVYLDDFGTGYSSLNYLHKFPVAALKIDRSFVTNILTDRTAQEIVRAIASLAGNLGMDIIVEGVEGQSELELFRRYNCGHVQGFIFSEPLDVPSFERFMTDFGQQGGAAPA